MAELTSPEPRVTVKYKGEDKTIFMSFLRLNSCLRLVGSMDRMGMMMVDPDIGEGIIRVLVAPKGGAGEMFEVELEDEDLSPDDFDKLLDFAREHLTYFFVKRLQTASKTVGDLESMIEALKLSAAGSEN